MVLFNSLYTRFWYRLQKNNEVMIEEDVCQITRRSIPCLRAKKDFIWLEKLTDINVKQIWYKNPYRVLIF